MTKTITIDSKKCTGCRVCELVCSFRLTGEFNPDLSAIKCVIFNEKPFFSALTCIQCGEPQCVAVCPTGAIERDEESGISIISERKCIGCMLCTLMCPYGGVYFSKNSNKAFKCDQCKGNPECVRFCLTGAIIYRDSMGLYEKLSNREDLFSPGLSQCLGCTMELATRIALKVLGRNTILATPPGCIPGSGSVGYGATTGTKVPVFHPLLTNTPAMLAGIKRHYNRMGRDVNVVAFAGDGGISDAGFQALSGAAERGENIIIICFDNEGYMNTGIQRSGTTTLGSWTTTTPVGKLKMGKEMRNKNLPMIMAMHDIPFVATINVAYINDFIDKLRYAMNVRDGMSYLHLFCPCPTGWKFPTFKSLEVCRMAVETNFSLLWESKNGKFKITVEVKEPKPVEAYIKLMEKYSHLKEKQIKEIQQIVDERFQVLNMMTKRGKK